MRRNPLIAGSVASAAGVTVAALLATGALPGSSTAGPLAPECLSSALEHPATLEGTRVNVSPAPGTSTANPYTQISFLGVPVTEIRDVSVVGLRSGYHHGSLRGYSQGDGGSFVPQTPFQPGERVEVRAVIGSGRHRKRILFHFGVDIPYPTADVPEFPNPPASPSEYKSFRTLPGVQAPVLRVTTPDGDPGAGDILTTNGPGPGRYGPLIYTPRGRLVWFDQLPKGVEAEDLKAQSYEGKPDLTFWRGKVLSLGFGQGEDIVMDSHYRTVARVPGGNGLRADLHDFQIAPHDVSYTTAFNAIRCDLSPAGGARDGVILDNAIQEIDMKTGLVRWEWHALDHVGTGESETRPPAGGYPWDWFHINSIDPEPDGNVFISARSTWAGYQLEAGTGNILWRLGGTRSSFKMGPGTKTAWQHDGRIFGGRTVTFFDNGSNPPVHRQSRALRIALDFKSHEARLRSVYTHPNPLLSASQGDVQTLPDRNTLIDYGAVPEISEYSVGGSLLFDAHLPLDMNTYRAFRFPWAGRPLDPPVVLANLNNTGEETIVHASWNGATEVASWRVLAGERPESLRSQATISASDFESSTILPNRYAYVEVRALDSSGHVIGASSTAHVIGYAASFTTTGRSG